MSDFYDKTGKPILDNFVWARLFRNREYCRVGMYEDERIEISTVWIGLNHNWSGGAPLIFETMTFVKPGADVFSEFDQLQYRWRTEDEAKEGHETLVRCYHEGIDPEEPMSEVKRKYV